MSVSAQAYFPAFKEKQRVAIVSGMEGRKETKDVTDLFYTFLQVSGVMAVLLVNLDPTPLLSSSRILTVDACCPLRSLT